MLSLMEPLLQGIQRLWLARSIKLIWQPFQTGTPPIRVTFLQTIYQIGIFTPLMEV
jgi:hypothetical protein